MLVSVILHAAYDQKSVFVVTAIKICVILGIQTMDFQLSLCIFFVDTIHTIMLHIEM